MSLPWFSFRNTDEIPSPALIVYPEQVEQNIQQMLAIAGGDPARLRPHVKTHKMPQIVRMQLQHGISKFKCATIAEAEMAARAGAPDVLLAYQPVGPNIARFVQLVSAFPNTHFSTIADDAGTVRFLSKALATAGKSVEVLLDLDCGFQRTGIPPGPSAIRLYTLFESLPGLRPGGIHAYDGHLRSPDPKERQEHVQAAFAPIEQFAQELVEAGLPMPRIVAGGTPTFPIHATRANTECSPGTCLLWDAGYDEHFPDLPFANAALVLTRVISKPGPKKLCLDLGHKSIGSEVPHPRVDFFNLTDATALLHGEEHLVLETEQANEFAVGDFLFGVPRHICPTVALYSEAIVVRNGEVEERWSITARDRVITI